MGSEIQQPTSDPQQANIICIEGQQLGPLFACQGPHGHGGHVGGCGAMSYGGFQGQASQNNARHPGRLQAMPLQPGLVTQAPRDPHLDGLLTAEDRDEDGVSMATTHAGALRLAKEHLQRLQNPKYVCAERRAARCATLAARQGVDNGVESIFATLLRRRSCFTELPVLQVDDSYVVVPGDKRRPQSVMVTSVSEDMHCRLAMQSCADAKAYLAMLNEHVDFMHAQAVAVPHRMCSLEAQEGASSNSGTGVFLASFSLLNWAAVSRACYRVCPISFMSVRVDLLP
jgi:hypothetical protein